MQYRDKEGKGKECGKLDEGKKKNEKKTDMLASRIRVYIYSQYGRPV
jgi:hypothetical protein